jgi:hypothetical protein
MCGVNGLKLGFGSTNTYCRITTKGISRWETIQSYRHLQSDGTVTCRTAIYYCSSYTVTATTVSNGEEQQKITRKLVVCL